MFVSLDKNLTQSIEKLAKELGVSPIDLLTKSINTYINVHQLKKQRGFDSVIVEGGERDGDITSWFFEDKVKQLPKVVNEHVRKQRPQQQSQGYD